jgi:hypothetical protein
MVLCTNFTCPCGYTYRPGFENIVCKHSPCTDQDVHTCCVDPCGLEFALWKMGLSGDSQELQQQLLMTLSPAPGGPGSGLTCDGTAESLGAGDTNCTANLAEGDKCQVLCAAGEVPVGYFTCVQGEVLGSSSCIDSSSSFIIETVNKVASGISLDLYDSAMASSQGRTLKMMQVLAATFGVDSSNITKVTVTEVARRLDAHAQHFSRQLQQTASHYYVAYEVVVIDSADTSSILNTAASMADAGSAGQGSFLAAMSDEFGISEQDVAVTAITTPSLFTDGLVVSVPSSTTTTISTTSSTSSTSSTTTNAPIIKSVNPQDLAGQTEEVNDDGDGKMFGLEQSMLIGVLAMFLATFFVLCCLCICYAKVTRSEREQEAAEAAAAKKLETGTGTEPNPAEVPAQTEAHKAAVVSPSTPKPVASSVVLPPDPPAALVTPVPQSSWQVTKSESTFSDSTTTGRGNGITGGPMQRGVDFLSTAPTLQREATVGSRSDSGAGVWTPQYNTRVNSPRNSGAQSPVSRTPQYNMRALSPHNSGAPSPIGRTPPQRGSPGSGSCSGVMSPLQSRPQGSVSGSPGMVQTSRVKPVHRQTWGPLGEEEVHDLSLAYAPLDYNV